MAQLYNPFFPGIIDSPDIRYVSEIPRYEENLALAPDSKKTVTMPLYPDPQTLKSILCYPKRIRLFSKDFKDDYLNVGGSFDYNSKYFVVDIIREKDGKFSTLATAPYMRRDTASGNVTVRGFASFFVKDSSAKSTFGLHIYSNKAESFGGHAFMPIVNGAYSLGQEWVSIDNFRFNEQFVSFDIEYGRMGSVDSKFTNMSIDGLIYC